MAETAKKSRIVSEECFGNYDPLTQDDTASLQDIINTEFNERLKHCMNENNTTLDEPPDIQPSNVVIKKIINSETHQDIDSAINTNTHSNGATQSKINDTQRFIENEIESELKNNISIQITQDENCENTNFELDTSPEADIDILNPEEECENKEIPSPENETSGELTPPYDNITVTDVDTEGLTAKERFLSTLETDIDQVSNASSDSQKLATVKDRMFLSTDSACLLFTQTVVQSPMLTPTLTPTEENYDFLQALKSKSPENVENNQIIDKGNEFLEKLRNERDLIENIEVIDRQESSEAEISAESDVCNQIESSNSENDLTDSQQIEEIKQDIKDFVREEILNKTTENFQEISERIRAEIVEPSIEISSNVSVEMVENLEKPIKKGQKICEISKIFSETNNQPTEKHLQGESEISLIALQEYPSDFETIKKTKELFEQHSKNIEYKSFSNLEDTNNFDFDSTTVTSESSFVETRTESSNTGEKILKKKKSKKSKKDNEKENISVTDLTNTSENDEETLSHVSVKNLCRSFSDLSSIASKSKGEHNHSKQYYGRAKSMSDIRKEDIPLDNVFSNVSVKYLKSSFSKFDALQKKTVLHVRSSDSGKAQEKFNGTAQIDSSSCKACQKQVFQMEQIKAEKAIWHKNCFRCKECNKQLNVDTYQSNEGVLYCKPHFKALFTPKAVEDEPQPIRPRRHEMIIRENQPLELPPDVVRASDKPDLGLEELQNLNVKERFQVFENHENQENSLERTSSSVNVKRSPSILSKLAKFQQKGMDIGVADDSLNGVPLEESSSEAEEEDDELDGSEDPNLIRARRAAAQREIPLHFNNMSEVMSKWESGNQMTKEERREERKQEIQSIRSRLFMGKQGKMKELYQQAVAESESGINVKKSVPLDTELCEGAKSIKDKFERGESLTHDEELKLRELEEDKGVFETGISKKSRSIFLELDANASKAPQLAPLSPSKSGTEIRRAREAFMARQASEDTVRATDLVDDVVVKTADISNKFKFFETYKEKEKPRKQFRITPPRDGQVKLPSPDRDVYRDPDIIRNEDAFEDDSLLAKKTHTATKMLNIFRQMEENLQKKDESQGPKPLKRFTPPPEGEFQRNESESEEEVSENEDDYDEDEGDHEQKIVDEDLIEAQKAARAKHLRAKFEKWEANEIQHEQNNSSVNLTQEIGEGDSQIESARSLRARFESMRETTDKERQPRIKVNRFVDQTNSAEICKCCQGRVYPLEKVACHNNIYHKNCFRCKECNAILRMDSYSYNQGLLYCLTHFKRLFAVKGNYESGFGLDQHKEKWNITAQN